MKSRGLDVTNDTLAESKSAECVANSSGRAGNWEARARSRGRAVLLASWAASRRSAGTSECKWGFSRRLGSHRDARGLRLEGHRLYRLKIATFGSLEGVAEPSA